MDTEIIRNGDSVKIIYSLTVRDYSFTVREPTKAEKLIEPRFGKVEYVAHCTKQRGEKFVF